MSAQNEIDKTIFKIFGKNKIFFEAGGSNPYDQSNTTFLEENGWSGLVVEPKEYWNKTYKDFRPNTILENYVLVSKNYDKEYIEGDFSHYMTGGVINIHNSKDWKLSKFPCITLEKLFNKHNINEIHFFSLDVEGYEKEVLEGIDFNSVFIHCMVVERHKIDDKWTNFDYLIDLGFEKVQEFENHMYFFNKKTDFKFNLYDKQECFNNSYKK